MMSWFRNLLICCAVCLSTGSALCQDFDWTIRLRGGEEYTNVALQRISNDTLYFSRNKNFRDYVVVDSLAELRRAKGGTVLPSTAIGAIAGGVLGYSIKPTSENQGEANVYGALFGMVIGGAAGYFAGTFLHADEILDLSNADRQSKISLIGKALQ